MDTDLTSANLGRAWLRLPSWRWMPGMLALGSKSHRTAWFRVIAPQTRLYGDWADAYPDTTDPATVGCLHALTEEIVGGPVNVGTKGEGWGAYDPRYDPAAKPGHWGTGPTKAHALYALVWEVTK
jgi:hypothetical protein